MLHSVRKWTSLLFEFFVLFLFYFVTYFIGGVQTKKLEITKIKKKDPKKSKENEKNLSQE